MMWDVDLDDRHPGRRPVERRDRASDSARFDHRAEEAAANARSRPTRLALGTGEPDLKAPLGANTAHLRVDMQRLFASEDPWPLTWRERPLPKVVKLVERERFSAGVALPGLRDDHS